MFDSVAFAIAKQWIYEKIYLVVDNILPSLVILMTLVEYDFALSWTRPEAKQNRTMNLKSDAFNLGTSRGSTDTRRIRQTNLGPS